MSKDQAQDISKRHKSVACAEKDDRTLWIVETLSVDDERQNCDGGRDKTQSRPQCDPELCEGPLVRVEVKSITWYGTVGLASGLDATVEMT